MRRYMPLMVLLMVSILVAMCGPKKQTTSREKIQAEIKIIPGDGDTISDQIIITNINNFDWHNVRIAYNNKYVLSQVMDDSNPNQIVYGTKAIDVIQAGETIETKKNDFRSQKAGTSTEELFAVTIQCDEGLLAKKFEF